MSLNKKETLIKIRGLEDNFKLLLINTYFIKELSFFDNINDTNFFKIEEIFEVPSNYKKIKNNSPSFYKKIEKFIEMKKKIDNYNIIYTKEGIKEYKKFIKECKQLFIELGFHKLQFFRIFEKYKFNYNTDLCKKLNKIKKEITNLKQILVEENKFFVISIAKQYASYTQLTIEDIIQEGMIGFIKAINMIDVTKNIELTTYAYNWVKHFISRAIYNQSKLIRTPIHIIEKMNKIKKYRDSFSIEHGREPTIDELSKISGIRKDTLLKIDSFHYEMSFLSDDSLLEKIIVDDRGRDILDYQVRDLLKNNGIDIYSKKINKKLLNPKLKSQLEELYHAYNA